MINPYEPPSNDTLSTKEQETALRLQLRLEHRKYEQMCERVDQIFGIRGVSFSHIDIVGLIRISRPPRAVLYAHPQIAAARRDIDSPYRALIEAIIKQHDRVVWLRELITELSYN